MCVSAKDQVLRLYFNLCLPSAKVFFPPPSLTVYIQHPDQVSIFPNQLWLFKAHCKFQIPDWFLSLHVLHVCLQFYIRKAISYVLSTVY